MIYLDEFELSEYYEEIYNPEIELFDVYITVLKYD